MIIQGVYQTSLICIKVLQECIIRPGYNTLKALRFSKSNLCILLYFMKSPRKNPSVFPDFFVFARIFHDFLVIFKNFPYQQQNLTKFPHFLQKSVFPHLCQPFCISCHDALLMLYNLTHRLTVCPKLVLHFKMDESSSTESQYAFVPITQSKFMSVNFIFGIYHFHQNISVSFDFHVSKSKSNVLMSAKFLFFYI